MTLEKKYEILKSAQNIRVFAEMLLVEHSQHLVDAHFKSAKLANDAKKIKERAEDIIRSLNQSVFVLKDEDEFCYNFVLNLFEIFSYLNGFSVKEIENFNNYLKEHAKQSEELIKL